jgi:DNA-directed RNA polymerase beta subunit
MYLKDNNSDAIQKVGIYNNFPLNQDGFLHSHVKLNVGDKVKKGQTLYDLNYSKNDTLALGKNLNVAFMSYKGYNFEDGAVLTESAAQALSHEMIHRINIYHSPKISIFDKKKFTAWFLTK